MAKQKQKQTRGYEFTVSGVYRGYHDRGTVKRFFKNIKVTLPLVVTYVSGRKWEVHPNAEGKDKKISTPRVVTQNVLACYKTVLKNYYLKPILQEKYEDFHSLRTFEVVSKKEVPLTGKQMSEKEIAEMSEAELLQFCALNDLNVELSGFGDLSDKKEAVKQEYNINLKKKTKTKNAKKASDENLDGYEPDDGIPVNEEDPTAAFM